MLVGRRMRRAASIGQEGGGEGGGARPGAFFERYLVA